MVQTILYSTSGVMTNLAKFCIAHKQISAVIQNSLLPKVHTGPLLAVLLLRSRRATVLLRGICFRLAEEEKRRKTFCIKVNFGRFISLSAICGRIHFLIHIHLY